MSLCLGISWIALIFCLDILRSIIGSVARSLFGVIGVRNLLGRDGFFGLFGRHLGLRCWWLLLRALVGCIRILSRRFVWCSRSLLAKSGCSRLCGSWCRAECLIVHAQGYMWLSPATVAGCVYSEYCDDMWLISIYIYVSIFPNSLNQMNSRQIVSHPSLYLLSIHI